MATVSHLSRVKNPQGRVDLLLARILEQAVGASSNPVVPEVYKEVRPMIEQILTAQLGPRTKRGKKLASDLFTLRDAVENVRRSQAKGAA